MKCFFCSVPLEEDFDLVGEIICCPYCGNRIRVYIEEYPDGNYLFLTEKE